ncbi:MAG: ABC transporter substrate-binding protein [Bacillota bacterium]
MKKNSRFIMAAIMLFFLMLAACRINPVEAAGYSVKLDPGKYKGRILQIWRQTWPETDAKANAANRKGMTEAEAIAAFEKATGAKIKIQVIPETEYYKKVVAAITAGSGPDIAWFNIGVRPAWMVKKLLRPLSDYIDFKDPEFQKASDYSRVTADHYSYKNKIYGINGLELSDRLYYNKEILEVNGQEDPYKLFKEGKWTWERFFEMAKALTLDTDGNGKIDQWGYQAWLSDQWFTSNGVRFVKFVNGKPVCNLEDEKVYHTLQTMYDIVFKIKFMPRVWWEPSPQVQFYKGKVAFVYWGYWEMAEMKRQMGRKLGIVPFPIGPGLQGKKKMADLAEVNGMGITACSKNPALAALFIKWLRVPDEAGVKAYDQQMLDLYGSQAMVDLVHEMSRNSVIPDFQGYGRYGEIFNNIRWIENQTPAQAVQSIKKMAQAAIDEVWGEEHGK